MKRKTILAVGATLALAATAMGAFPSPWNPAGVNASQIKQYIALTWDDNAYSGHAGTQYEHRTGTIPFAQANFIAGVHPWTQGQGPGQAPNTLNLVETGGSFTNTMGLNWAYRALARGEAITGGAQSNGIPMTFNMITGLYVNRESGTWDNSQSVLGTYEPSTQESASHSRIAVTWGREFSVPGGTAHDGVNQITRATQALMAAGSEIGNHTIDHMESNSPLVGGSPRAAQFTVATSRPVTNEGVTVSGPVASVNQRTISAGGKTWQLGFDNWNNVGFAPEQVNRMNWGTTIDEVQEFGSTSAGTPSQRGWLIFAGRQITREAWLAYIQFSEIFLLHQGTGWSSPGVTRANLKGFRAPRLEVNSAMFFALKEAQYTYDMGLEDGYEWHRVGPNFLWPYDMANGVQNSWTQFSSGNRVFVDSTPAGFWQLPSTPVIVPEDIREDVWENHRQIMVGAGTPAGVDEASKQHWLRHGKVTGFDFNTWILYGMTGPNWQRTMRHTLDMRLNGNKAPMQFGMHTDYYTPIYDFATLQNSFNINGWGLPVTQNWNTWQTRQRETESFVNYAIQQGAEFVTGAQLIAKVDSLAKIGEAKATAILPASQLPSNWTWFEGTSGDVNNATSTAISNLNGNVRIASTFVPDQPRFAIDVSNVDLSSMTHISLDYKQTSASMIRLVLEDGSAREVMLAHRFPIVSNEDPAGGDNGNFNNAQLRPSGMIPISAFDFPANTEHPMNYSAVDVSKISAIEIQPLAPYAKPIAFGQSGWSNVPRSDLWEARFVFSNFRIHTGTPFDFTVTNPVEPNPPVAIVRSNNAGARSLSIAGMTSKALRLSIAQAGVYNVGVYTVNGRLVQSFNARNLTAGINELDLNNLARGVHIVRVQGVNTNQQLTRQVLIR